MTIVWHLILHLSQESPHSHSLHSHFSDGTSQPLSPSPPLSTVHNEALLLALQLLARMASCCPVGF